MMNSKGLHNVLFGNSKPIDNSLLTSFGIDTIRSPLSPSYNNDNMQCFFHMPSYEYSYNTKYHQSLQTKLRDNPEITRDMDVPVYGVVTDMNNDICGTLYFAYRNNFSMKFVGLGTKYE